MTLGTEAEAIIEKVPYLSANLANLSAMVYGELEDLNWAGFYLMQEGKLVLGPFQGKMACTEIAVGNGVCGTAVERNETLAVDDVHQFPTHIACDGASNSEIVIPIHRNGTVFGVLDVDSPKFARFAGPVREELEGVVRALEKYLPGMR